jgi:hypothetical protein
VTTEQAYEQLAVYIEGGLSVTERRELERLASLEPDLADAIILCRTVDFALESQSELTPRLDFTVDVLRKCGIINDAVESPRAKLLRRVERWAPVVGIAGALVLFTQPLWALVKAACTYTGDLVGRTTGITVFVSEPLLILAVLAPILLVGVAALAFSDRWKISRY